jgi:hypothetical protein
MAVKRKLEKLVNECLKRGIHVDDSEKHGKAYYTDLLREYHLNKLRDSGKSSKAIEWVNRTIDSPMLALAQSGVAPEQFDREVLSSGMFAVQEKLDGNRILIVYYPDEGFSFFGRNVSVKDFLVTNYTNHIYGLSQSETKGLFWYVRCTGGIRWQSDIKCLLSG